ncbi:MAG: hypothetical protein WEB88_16975 [Gemmatimonadota bacterium]
MHLLRSCLALLFLSGVMPLTAQEPRGPRNISDVSGTVVTSGDVAPGIFSPASVEAAFSFASPAAATAVRAGVLGLQAALASQALERGGAAAARVPLAPDAQRLFADLLRCASACDALVARTTAALAPDAPGAPRAAPARALALALRGLGRTAETGSAVELASRLQEAATAFHALVGEAGVTYLGAPPAELDVAHALLLGAIRSVTESSGNQETS